MKTYTIAFVCHQSQKKSRSDDGDGLDTHLEEEKEERNTETNREKNWDGILGRWQTMQLEMTQNGGSY